MFGKSVQIFSLFGFRIKVDFSWTIIAVLLTWSLASGVFPSMYPDFSTATYWVMGIVGALSLFFSIILHEISHALVARRYDMAANEITLFVFGGVASIEKEPPTPAAEFFMAIAGPAASVAIGLVLLGVHQLGGAAGWPDQVLAVLGYLWTINLILAVFNMIPAFPLDGGRVLRAGLWKWKNDLRKATRIASWAGSAFGFLLMFLGFYNILIGSFIGGIWWIFIGMFVRYAAQTSYKKVIITEGLRGERVRRFMKRDPVTVPPSATLSALVEDYVYTYHYKMFPVQDNGKLAGCITTREVKSVDREKWSTTTVGEALAGCSEDNTISPDADATEALTRMHRSGNSRLMVVENDRLVGIVSLKDMLTFLSMKLDLEQGETRNLQQ